MARATEALRAAGVTRLFLEVASTNDVARRLYADLGFVETGLRRGYFRSGTVDDAVTMVKTLEP
jgi:ribosomal-protein-alanine N-acetyltransferase